MTLCEHCQYRQVRTKAQPGGKPARFCSDRCQRAAAHRRHNDNAVDLTNDIRRILGLPAGGWRLSVAELEAIHRRLRRVLPYDGLAMHKPRHRKAA